jgi:hypothetical protein
MTQDDRPIIIFGIRQIADAHGVTDRLLKDLMKLEGFPAMRLGRNGTWLSTRAALESWVDRRLRICSAGVRHDDPARARREDDPAHERDAPGPESPTGSEAVPAGGGG